MPGRINDYRPISCCNIIFKCISKIIANRIKGDLGDLVSINQSAFVPGRRISDNILLTQELMRNYHRNCGPPRCSFKIDIQKAYDFHNVVGVFSVDLIEAILILLLLLWKPLEEFKNVSGLVPSIPKSTAFFCNVPNDLKASILNLTPFAEGTLPVRYLGVPLISTRLLYRDCKVLVEKLESRVYDWREMKKGKAKVAWDSVCMPQKEGGFRIRMSKTFNTLDEVLGCSCLRDVRLGDGGGDKVSDLISNGAWRWPSDWYNRFPDVVSIPVPEISESCNDCLVWRDHAGVYHPFLVDLTWDSIRPHTNIVDWRSVVSIIARVVVAA
ncbi:protein LAZ1 [Tanacetum coccineum]